MDAQDLTRWVEQTTANRPALDKDLATQIFIKYKNALSGGIEWRPVEILPEDFMAI